MKVGWLLFAVVVFGVGCDSGGKKEGASEAPRRSGDSPAVASPTPQPTASESYRVVTKRIDEKKTAPRYEIAMEYPALEGAQMHTAWESFNRLVADTVAGVVSDFKESLAGLEPLEGVQELGSSLHSRFEVATETPELISLLLTSDEFMEGAAHPMSTLWSFTYDLTNNRPVALRNLFLPESGYLDSISKMALAQLTAQFGDLTDPEMLRTGTAPDEESFRNFTLGRDSLVIDFDAYQVGPYALGRPRIAIAYNSLSTILSPDGPVARLGTAR